MKKIIIAISTLLLVTSTTMHTFAATKTPTPTPTTSPSTALQQQITNLKDKIASRVAQLNLVEKRGIIGTVTNVQPTQIILTDIQGNTRFVDVDELTKFSSPASRGNFGISDITKGETIGVLGLYNKESRRILARFVDVMDMPVYIQGAITSIDKTNYTLSVLTADKSTYLNDIETNTKTEEYDGTQLVKAGFSKAQQAERIIILGYADKSNTKHIITSRVLLFPTLPIDPRITVLDAQALQLQGTVVPATGSGKKLTPLTK